MECLMDSGCSIIMDGWMDISHRPLINIMVTCTKGPYFLKAVDCSGHRKDVDFQYHVLKDAIEEVGPQNVVQVVTNAAHVCKAATPCCVHAMNNALKDMGKIEWIRKVVNDEKRCRCLSAITIHHM